MYTTKKVTRSVEETVITSLICNKCGKIVKLDDPESAMSSTDNDRHARSNFFLFEAEGGYESDYPGDMIRVRFLLCSDCLMGLVNSMVVPAEEKFLLASHYEEEEE